MSKTFPIIVVLLCGLLLVSGCAPLKTPSAKPPPLPSGEPDQATDAVVRAEVIVLGTISALRYEQTPTKFTYTIFTLSVEKMIKGDPATGEIFIRVAGGLAQIPTGLWYFSVGDRVLVGLSNREDGSVFLSPTVFWIESKTTGIAPAMGLQESLGRVIQIMRANDIPIALPRSEWPPLPVGPIRRPEKATPPFPQPPKKSP